LCDADADWRRGLRSDVQKDRLAEDMEFFDFGTIFFLVAAVVIFFQLRNVLGRRTGNERPPFDPYTIGRKRDKETANTSENVVSLPRKRAAGEADETYKAIDAFAPPGGELNKGLRAIKDVDPSFEPKSFVDGAKMAYEMIVMAYADGDRKTLKNLLSREVYDGFVAAIAEREGRSEKIQSSFVGIDKADIVSAEMKGSEAHATLRIVSELISATRNNAGEVVDGDPETVAEVKDVWTFSRDTRSRDPNWKLVATEAED
jgi:predicted lipid-binding transport protein (Tim44 family)